MLFLRHTHLIDRDIHTVFWSFDFESEKDTTLEGYLKYLLEERMQHARSIRKLLVFKLPLCIIMYFAFESGPLYFQVIAHIRALVRQAELMPFWKTEMSRTSFYRVWFSLEYFSLSFSDILRLLVLIIKTYWHPKNASRYLLDLTGLSLKRRLPVYGFQKFSLFSWLNLLCTAFVIVVVYVLGITIGSVDVAIITEINPVDIVCPKLD